MNSDNKSKTAEPSGEPNPYFHLNQVIGDYYDCNLELNQFSNENFMLKSVNAALERVNTTVLQTNFHKFEPHGLTILMVLADSSLTLHTWPEERFITVEIFTCSERSRPILGLEYLKKIFHAKNFKIHKISRK